MSDQMQVCPACGVKIAKGGIEDRVIFSSGLPGTRSMLWARVCQYAKKPGCINRDPALRGQVNAQDYYQFEINPPRDA